jgi:sulfur carrier protein
VNGRLVELPEPCSVTTLLRHLKTENGQIAVERTEEVVPRRDWAECWLSDGDRIEIVTFVGGG